MDASGFAIEFDAIIDEMINASTGIYRALIQVQSASRNGASQWNLRDLFRCVYGLLLSVPETIEDVAAMKRLWLHESLRAFSDPLSPSAGLYDTVSLKAQQCCEQFLNVTLAQLFAQLDMVELADLAQMTIESIFFCDFSDPKSESRSYLEGGFVFIFVFINLTIDCNWNWRTCNSYGHGAFGSSRSRLHH